MLTITLRDKLKAAYLIPSKTVEVPLTEEELKTLIQALNTAEMWEQTRRGKWKDPED